MYTAKNHVQIEQINLLVYTFLCIFYYIVTFCIDINHPEQVIFWNKTEAMLKASCLEHYQGRFRPFPVVSSGHGRHSSHSKAEVIYK